MHYFLGIFNKDVLEITKNGHENYVDHLYLFLLKLIVSELDFLKTLKIIIIQILRVILWRFIVMRIVSTFFEKTIVFT